MSSQALELCFYELKKVEKLEDIDRIIDEHFPIKQPRIEPIQKMLNNNSRQMATQNHETPFVPSTELLKSYQQTFSRANQDQRITNTKNYKLEANFSNPVPQRNAAAGKQERGRMLQQAIIVQDKEAIILEQLRSGKIQATIPNMERTLFTNELSHLQQKQVVIENTLSINDWKKLRSRFGQ